MRPAVAPLALLLAACGADPEAAADLPEPASVQGPAALRRLTAREYRNVIHDVFGEEVAIPWRLEPDVREAGLLGVGAASVSVTPSGLEDYEAAARGIVAQVVSPGRREAWVRCAPAGPTDDACAEATLARVGALLLRRPLEPDELAARVELSRAGATAFGDFHEGLGLGLSSLLLAPSFLFRAELTEPGVPQLTPLSLASRLSFLLWASAPDEALLAAATDGSLGTAEGLDLQVDRLIADPRFLRGVRSLFADLLQLDALDDVRKDEALFPAFDDALVVEAREQTLRTVEQVVDADDDIRTLWTTRQTALTRKLGLVYRQPVAAAEGWQDTRFPEDGPRAGLLTHVSLLSLLAHAGRSSATLRGRFVREVLLCDEIPGPPTNVDFSALEGTAAGPTARDRLTVHMRTPACANCHEAMDPVGLALEQFDALGAFRTEEAGALIDPSGELDGLVFDDAVGLGVALADHPALAPCLVDTVWRAATGRQVEPGEAPLLTWMDARLATSGHSLRALLRDVATSEAFRHVSGPREAAP